MKLDRNISGDGRGKYGIVRTRKLAEIDRVHSPQGASEIDHAINVLEAAGILDWGTTQDTEFFVILLKDRNASAALYGYAGAAQLDGDRELAADVSALAVRAGINHPNCKRPD